MSNYFEIDALSISALKDLKRSELFFYKRNITKEIEREDTAQLTFGNAVHTALLEKDKFTSRYLVADVDLRTKVGKEKKAEAEAKNMKLIKTEEYLQSLEMVGVLQKKTTYKKLLSKTDKILVEHELLTEFEGVKVKGKCDVLSTEKKFILDYKTIENCSDRDIVMNSYKYGYHNQAAWYIDLVKKIYGIDCMFLFIFQEKTAPYDCKFFGASEDFIRKGREENAELFARYKKCKETGIWSGYEDKFEVLELPQYIK